MARNTARSAIHLAKAGYAPEDMQYHFLHFVFLVVFSSLATTVVILRFWARKIQHQPLALTDCVLVLGLVSFENEHRLSLPH